MQWPFFTDQAVFTRTVKNRPLVKIEAPLERAAADIIGSVPGVEAVLTRPQTGDGGEDAVIHAAGVAHPVAIQVKRYVNAGTVHQLIDMAGRLPAGTGFVIVADRATAEARHMLEDRGIGFIDGLGNVGKPALSLRRSCRGHMIAGRSTSWPSGPPCRPVWYTVS